jgi:hypothetical protein
MSNDLFPLTTDFDKALNEARQAIAAALALIDNQEDGPMTMCAAINEIRDRVDSMETEAWLKDNDLLTATEVGAKLREQLGEVIRQRDHLLRWVMQAQRASTSRRYW